MNHGLNPDDLADLLRLARKGRSAWEWVRDDAGRILNPGIEHDGTNIVNVTSLDGLPADQAVRAVLGALRKRAAKRSAAASKVAQTRSKRQQRTRAEVIALLNAGGHLKPSMRCRICRKALETDDARQRGIGSECWAWIVSELRTNPQPPGMRTAPVWPHD